MSHQTSVQPGLTDLMARYLQKQADAQAVGIATFDGEVTPYEVGPVQPLDPKLAWDEALAVLAFYGPTHVQRRQAPPHWSHLVANHESIVAVAFSAANFPQLMRNFHAILGLGGMPAQPNLAELRPVAGRPSTASELTSWVDEVAHKKEYPQTLLALGTLRLAKHFDAAEAFVRAHDADIPAAWRTGWENEKAALAWHSGRYEDARKIWDSLEATVPVLFNRGMAALFAGNGADAKQHLTAAIAKLPASSSWHHLGRLYLILADLGRA
jgi:tetratricopeptide (TPR) repeat protein